CCSCWPGSLGGCRCSGSRSRCWPGCSWCARAAPWSRAPPRGRTRAGGGSRRTHEINRRLAARGHEVTVLTTRFPGHRDRVEDGVRYVHIGFGAGRSRVTRTAGYALAAVGECRRRQADLVVEDFFAPVSSAAVPLWSGRPTVGVVQWLNA